MKKNQSDSYLVYARKSTDDADNQKNSIAYQIGECLRYAEKNSLALCDMSTEGFCEDGIIREKHSAYKVTNFEIAADGAIRYEIERPKFNKLIGLLAKREIAGIVCLCWDRISRNDQDGMIIKSLMDRGVDIRFVQTQYEKTSSGALHRDIDGMFASHYSRVISEKVKAAYQKLRSEGKCTYISPIGYLDNGSDDKPLDSVRAPTVKRVFELCSEGGWSLHQLAKWATQQGLTTKPSRPKRTHQEILSGEDNFYEKISRPVTHKSIENILKNPFYIGKLKVGEDIFDGTHQPLINVSLYNKVQEVLKSRRVSIYYVDKDFFTYRGLIKCSCGRSYSPYTQKGINYYRSRCIEGCRSTDVNLNEIQIDEEIEKLMGTLHFTDEELAEIEVRAKEGLKITAKKRNSALDDLHTRQRRAYADLDYLKQNKITLLRNGTAIQEYNADIVRIEKELDVIATDMNIYKEAEHEMLKYVLTFSELVKNAQLYYEHALDTEKRDIATQVFSELTFADRKLFHYKTKEGFDALLNCRFVSSGSPCWPTFEHFSKKIHLPINSRVAP